VTEVEKLGFCEDMWVPTAGISPGHTQDTSKGGKIRRQMKGARETGNRRRPFQKVQKAQEGTLMDWELNVGYFLYTGKKRTERQKKKGVTKKASGDCTIGKNVPSHREGREPMEGEEGKDNAAQIGGGKGTFPWFLGDEGPLG